MKKYLLATYKEILILFRDKSGLLLLFIMPISLVLIISSVMHRTFNSVYERDVPLILINNDMDSVGTSFEKGIHQTTLFETEIKRNADSIAIAKARKDVSVGKYQIGIFIPEGTTKSMQHSIISVIGKQLPGSLIPAGMGDKEKEKATIQIFFDPTVKKSFKLVLSSTLNEFLAEIKSRFIFITYSNIFNAITNQYNEIDYTLDNIVTLNETYVSEYLDDPSPNSVQHSVPAWTIFAMFFVCIPLAGSFIKERDDGCLYRLKTMPVSYITILMGKISAYVLICIIQATLIISMGVFVIPLLNLPPIVFLGSIWEFAVLTIAVSLAATGYGIAIGSFSSSLTQASSFGSVSVVILAALGGIWVPHFLMPDLLKTISNFSPLNWAINGYYDIFLRSGETTDLLLNTLKLLLFFLIALIVSYLYRRHKTIE